MLAMGLKICSFYILINCILGIVATDSIKEDIRDTLAEYSDKSFELLIQEIMIKSLQAYKCVAVIRDSMYSELFKKSWFEKFGGFISYILVNVEESEDLLAPNNNTKDSLKMAKNDGCQLYIILIANGLQAARLLKFGDSIKEDIRDTLAEYSDKSFELLIQEIMIKSLQAYKCVAVIRDSMYSELFKKSWFEKFGGFISYILVNVEESEDLLAPNNNTKDSLKMAKNDGCQLYIILIANGLQAARLLKFGDRYRVLDTRANFILLFDNRLFDKKIFYLWKRIINVVFIKRYSGKGLNERISSKNSWYELTTVPFPTNFEDILIPRRLDIWAQSKFRKGADFFKDKTFDLKNQTLKVAAFPHIPGTVRENSSLGSSIRSTFLTNNNEYYSGTEIEILKTVSQSMNFQCELYEPDNADIELWGRKQVGGIYTGLLGEMTTAKADLALGDLYYIPFMLEVMDLSIPYNTECLTFITPESLTDISWKTLILPFSPLMWTGVIIGLVLCSISFFTLSHFHQYISKIKKMDRKNSKNRAQEIEMNKRKMFVNLSIYSQILKVDSDLKYSMLKDQYQTPKEEDDPEGLYQFSEAVNSILYTYSMLLLVSLPKLPTGWSLRVLTGWYWIYCLLVVVAYRASMTAILARPTPTVTIDTLQELIDSRLQFVGWGEINSQFFSSSRDNSIKRIVQNFQIANNSDDAIDRVANGKCAFYENTYFLKEAILKRQTRYQENMLGNQTSESKGTVQNIIRSDRSLHIMKDCIINMPISIGLQKNSPLRPRVDKFIARVLEAGLVEKWLNDVMQKILIDKVDNDSEGQKALMNLKKMYGALVVLGIGYVLGLFMLAGEIFYFHYYVTKNPGYNRYSRRVHENKKGK